MKTSHKRPTIKADSGQKRVCSSSSKSQDGILGTISFGHGHNIAVSLNIYGDSLYVGIRHFEWTNGKLKPTRKGVHFPAVHLEEIGKLLSKAKQIRDA